MNRSRLWFGLLLILALVIGGAELVSLLRIGRR